MVNLSNTFSMYNLESKKKKIPVSFQTIAFRGSAVPRNSDLALEAMAS